MVEFKDRLRDALVKKGLDPEVRGNLRKFAHAIGVEYQAAVKWLKGGVMSAKTLSDAADYLECDARWLLTGEGGPDFGRAGAERTSPIPVTDDSGEERVLRQILEFGEPEERRQIYDLFRAVEHRARRRKAISTEESERIRRSLDRLEGLD